ncbi:MAG: transposase [Chloroflexi bacterium]|nr:transposase [Chloroflexota bacterium]
MLTLVGEQVESLWDEVLPAEIRELPDDLERLDRVLADSLLLLPIAQAWERDARERGRPSIAMTTFVRLMVIKQRTGWGYETLVREVSDSLHLRRFCLIAIDQRVPDESTVRKLARRLGASVVQEITRMVIEKAQRETRFIARAARIDSTVVEADIRYPSDAMLALQGARALAREGKKLQKLIAGKPRVRDRSRSIGKTVRAISKTLARRTGEAKAQVMTLNQQAGRLIARSAREANRLAAAARASARGRRASTKLRAARQLEALASRCGRVAEQIDRRVRGLKITDRLVSIADPDARPIRKGKLGKPTEFGYVAQICEMTENTRKGARGSSSRPATRPGTRPRTRCCRRPPPNWTAPGSARGRSWPTAASSPARPKMRSPSSPTTGSSSPAATSQAPGAPANAERAIARGSRAESATSNAATACAAPG